MPNMGAGGAQTQRALIKTGNVRNRTLIVTRGECGARPESAVDWTQDMNTVHSDAAPATAHWASLVSNNKQGALRLIARMH